MSHLLFSFKFNFLTLLILSLQKCKNPLFIEYRTAIINAVELNLCWIRIFLDNAMKTIQYIIRINYQLSLYDCFMKILNSYPVLIPKIFRYRNLFLTLMFSLLSSKLLNQLQCFLGNKPFTVKEILAHILNLALIPLRKDKTITISQLNT